MTARVSASLRNAMWDAVRARFNGRKVEFRTGSRPASPETAASGTLLGTAVLNATAFQVAVAGSITANAVTRDASADTDGTIGYIRIYETDDATGGLDLTVGLIGSGADAELPTLSVSAGQPLEINPMVLTIPNP